LKGIQIADAFFVACPCDGTFWQALALRKQQGLRSDSQTAVYFNNQSSAAPSSMFPNQLSQG